MARVVALDHGRPQPREVDLRDVTRRRGPGGVLVVPGDDVQEDRLAETLSVQEKQQGIGERRVRRGLPIAEPPLDLGFRDAEIDAELPQDE